MYQIILHLLALTGLCLISAGAVLYCTISSTRADDPDDDADDDDDGSGDTAPSANNYDPATGARRREFAEPAGDAVFAPEGGPAAPWVPRDSTAGTAADSARILAGDPRRRRHNGHRIDGHALASAATDSPAPSAQCGES